MKLIVGLGNPGRKYQLNRHNIGFLVLDELLNSWKISFSRKKNYNFARFKNVIFIKPKTYMNRSGEAVKSVMTSYPIEEMLVIVDDINLPFGELRLRKEGGSGGHNGLKSIQNACGSTEYNRMRIGVGAPQGEDLSNFVLSNFSKQETDALASIYDFSKELLLEYIDSDFDKMIEKFSRMKKSYSEKFNSRDR